jgi:polar amino acid transport system substrate-binding protein
MAVFYPKTIPNGKNLLILLSAGNDNRKLREQWFNLEEGSFPYTILNQP